MMAFCPSKIIFFIACPRCITEIPNTQSVYKISSSDGHKCAQTVLLAQEVGTQKWFRIRDRTYQTIVTTTLSIYATSCPPQHCAYNDMICPCAHSAMEQHLWQSEVEGKSNIFEIITSHRKVGLNVFENVGSYFMAKFGGWLRCVCRVCLNECVRGGSTCCGPDCHDWNHNKVLVHCSLWDFEDRFNIVERSGMHFGNGRQMPVLCKLLDYCPDQENCAKYHSYIERDFAFVRRHCPTITMEQVCEKLNVLKMTVTHWLSYQASRPSQKSPDFRLTVLCKGCQQLGVDELENGRSDVCSRGHSWKDNKGAAVLDIETGKWIPVKPLPEKLPKVASGLKMCRHKVSGWCSRMDQCQFAHSQLEKCVWTWQMTSEPRVVNLVKYIEAQRSQAESIERRIIAGVGSVHRQSSVHAPANYCRYCDKQCNSPSQFAQHCRSKDHVFTVTADQDHAWKFRIPPAGGQFELCLDNEEGMCEYSGVAEEYNQCVKAHSSDELEEWNDRARYRQAKLKLAQQNNAADSTYQNVSEFSSELHGAEVTSDDALEVHLIEKNASCTWNFHIEDLTTSNTGAEYSARC